MARNPAFQMVIPQFYIRFVTRLLSRIDMSGGPNACWPWMGQRDKDGYGSMYDPRVDSNRRAHRLLWDVIGLGELDPATFLLHSCDNPPCCNPRHLTPGTNTDNVHDMIVKDRRKCPPRNRVSLICQYPLCSRAYEVIRSHASWSKHCSKPCYSKHRSMRLRAEPSPKLNKRVKLTCQNPACGKEYEIVPSNAPMSKYCSKSCKGHISVYRMLEVALPRRKAQRISLQCQYLPCSKSYSAPRSRAAKSRHCSEQCRKQHREEKRESQNAV